jgi:Xaa-Pro aminopeptidase
VDKKRLDLAVISNPNNVYYYTGFQTNRPILSEVLSWTIPAYLIVAKNEDPLLLVGEKDRVVAAETFGGQILTYENYNLKKRMIAYPNFIADEMKKFLTARTNTRRIGVETWQISQVIASSIKQNASAECVDLSSDILGMRTVKDPDD